MIIPSEEEEFLEGSGHGVSIPMGNQIFSGQKSFHSEASTILNYQPRAAITPNYCYKQRRYQYEYGYNGHTRHRRLYIARQGSNLYNLGAKLKSSIERKPEPIGS